METKICNKCGNEKDINYFTKRSELKSGRAAHCKACASLSAMEWNKLHPENVKASNKTWRDSHSEDLKERKRQYSADNVDKVRETHRVWRKNNPEKSLALINRAAAVRLSTPKGRINNRIASAIRLTLKNGSKGRQHWEDLLGFTIEQLMSHLEKLFTSEMSWENYGTYWSIDHKAPVAVFNFEKPSDVEFRLCWSIKNLQPLEKIANIKKGMKVDEEFLNQLRASM